VLFVGLVTSCNDEPSVRSPAPDAASAGVAAPGEGDPAAPARIEPAVGRVLSPAVARALLDGSATDAQRQLAEQDAPVTVAALLAEVGDGDVTVAARAPAAIRALGTAALPGLVDGLTHAQVPARRVAALTLLQWSDELHQQGAAGPVLTALERAREDADPSVRAAATHAFLRATGDTSALDESRAADEAAQRSDH